MKSEARNPRSERNPKTLARSIFGFRLSGFFRISAFGFRICSMTSSVQRIRRGKISIPIYRADPGQGFGVLNRAFFPTFDEPQEDSRRIQRSGHLAWWSKAGATTMAVINIMKIERRTKRFNRKTRKPSVARR